MAAVIPPASAGIRCAGVRYRYAGASRFALDGIDLELVPGEVTGLVGAGEAGKSTLCLVLAGLAPATIGGELQGTVEVGGVRTVGTPPSELAQRCGILFQEPMTQLSAIAPTVWEEVAFGPRNLGLPLSEVIERTEGSLDALRIGDLARRDPQRLSGGQAQLVALASVLAVRPGALVLDEPTAQLDPAGTRLVAEALAELAASGRTILLAEQRTDLLAELCRRVIVLEGGRVALDGPAAQVLGDERLQDLGVAPPAAVRLRRRFASAGLDTRVLGATA